MISLLEWAFPADSLRCFIWRANRELEAEKRIKWASSLAEQYGMITKIIDSGHIVYIEAVPESLSEQSFWA